MVIERESAYIDLNKNLVEITPVPLDHRKKFLGGRVGIGWGGFSLYFLCWKSLMC